MRRDNSIYLRHIRDAIERIDEYTPEMTIDNFRQSNLVQAAVIREIEIIGEATKILTTAFRRKYPKIPWRKMGGMRDKLIHDYFGVDADAVWDSVQRDLPILKRQIAEILNQNQGFLCS
jgi:uncharacterized protein with HEPN domain